MSLFSVKWDQVFENPSIPTDFTFWVKDPNDEDNNSVPISSHKLLLALVSPVFKEQFYGQLAISENRVDILDSEPQAFIKFLEFIHKGSQFSLTKSEKFSDVATIILIINVMVLADKYNLNVLKMKCEETLVNNIVITEDNVFDIVKIADQHKEDFNKLSSTLRSKCSGFIKENISKYNYNFVEKISAKPTFSYEIFKELVAEGYLDLVEERWLDLHLDFQ